jgi:hypothetical protein
VCEFISWKEIKCPDGSTQILFLTYDDIHNTSRGLELRNHTTGDDLRGHGAIDFYYQLNGKGKNRECTDFSTPDNFPKEIVVALKAGLMRGVSDYFPNRLLTAALDADYKAKTAPLYADYEAKRAPLDADYKAKRAALDADYKAKRAPLDADYKAKTAALYADYKAKRAPLDDAQWDLFLNPDNRCNAWK